jgi:hypothetical protein
MLQALGSDNRTKIVFAMFAGCCLLAMFAIIMAQIERYDRQLNHYYTEFTHVFI